MSSRFRVFLRFVAETVLIKGIYSLYAGVLCVWGGGGSTCNVLLLEV